MISLSTLSSWICMAVESRDARKPRGSATLSWLSYMSWDEAWYRGVRENEYAKARAVNSTATPKTVHFLRHTARE